MANLFKAPKAPKPEDDPQTRALLDISRNVLKNTEAQSYQLGKNYLAMGARDLSDAAKGAANVDTQMSIADMDDAAIARSSSSGGLGSGASLGVFDSGAVGGALQTAQSGAANAELTNRGKNMMSAVGAVQSGADTAQQGMRSAAQQGTAQALTDFQDKAQRKVDNINLAGQIGQGVMQGSQMRQTMQNNAQLKQQYNQGVTDSIAAPYFQGPISLAGQQYGPSYVGPYRPGLSFTNPNFNPFWRPPMTGK